MTTPQLKTLDERYLNDWAFQRVVNAIVWAIRYHGMTDIGAHDAFNFAMAKVRAGTQGER